MPVTIQHISWGGWLNCHRISNGLIELIVTADIGPRIMRCGFIDGPNFFKVFEDQLGKSGESDWQLRGGHRIWLAPEHSVRTYAPDNGPAEIETADGILTATQPVEAATGLQKQLRIRLSPEGAAVAVVHRMRNTLPFPVEISAWALTMMAPGGAAITGFPTRASHADALAPTNPLVMWAFTNLADPRWNFLEKYLILRHDPANTSHTKLGLFNPDTWGAYLLGTDLFFKWAAADPTRPYPDFGCSCELFASDVMLEIETLSPLLSILPGEWIEHTENWSLHRNVTLPAWTDSALDCVFVPLLAGRTATHVV